MKRQTSHHTSLRSQALTRGADILIEAFLRSKAAAAAAPGKALAPAQASPVEEMEDVLPWIGEAGSGASRPETISS